MSSIDMSYSDRQRILTTRFWCGFSSRIRLDIPNGFPYIVCVYWKVDYNIEYDHLSGSVKLPVGRWQDPGYALSLFGR